VSTQQQQVSAAILAKDHRSQPALKLPDRVGSPVGALEALVEEVVAGLEARPVDEPLCAVVARCNVALEDYLERERQRDAEARDGDDPLASRDELRRLLRLLRAADRAEQPLVVRAIRRVLGRLDGCGIV
jgi:hypothetical protein